MFWPGPVDDRLDWPVCTAAASYSQVMNLVIDYLGRYPDSLRDAVLGGHAEKFWKLTSNLRDSHRVPSVVRG